MLLYPDDCFTHRCTWRRVARRGRVWTQAQPARVPSPSTVSCFLAVTWYQFPPLWAGRRVVPTQDRCGMKPHCARGAARRKGRGSCPEEESCDRQKAAGTKVGRPQAAGPAWVAWRRPSGQSVGCVRGEGMGRALGKQKSA